MILTLTPNPALDQTAWVDELNIGGINRIGRTALDPAGKGVNASRMIDRLGWPTVAFGFVAGETGDIIVRALDAEGVQHHFVRVQGMTRVNMTVVDGQRATSFFGPGPHVGPESQMSLERVLMFWFKACKVLVLAGSLPPGVPTEFYSALVRTARSQGAKVVLDADGEALRMGLLGNPDLIKPNRTECERLLGRPLPDITAVLRAGRELLEQGIGAVTISLGSEGAVLVAPDGAWRAVPPHVERRSTIGSGDSMVAGLAVAMAGEEHLSVGLKLGTAAGAATAAATGTGLGRMEDVRRYLPEVQLERIA